MRGRRARRPRELLSNGTRHADHDRLAPPRTAGCDRSLRPPPHRARARRDPGDARGPRPPLAGRPDREDASPRHPPGPAARPPGGPERGRDAGRAGPDRGGERGLPELHRSRIPRDRDPTGDPAQHHGEPGLVHPVHALPGGDRPGSPGGPSRLPDDGQRSHGHGHLELEPAGRGDGRRRGDAPVLRGESADREPDGIRRRGLPPADRGRDADAGEGPGHRGGGRGSGDVRLPGRRGGRGPALPHDGRAHPGPPRLRREGPRAGGAGRLRRGSPLARAARAAGCLGGGRRGREHPALRRAHGLRRTPRRLPRDHGRLQAPDAGSDRRRVRGCGRAAGAPARAPDARAAHPA